MSSQQVRTSAVPKYDAQTTTLGSRQEKWRRKPLSKLPGFEPTTYLVSVATLNRRPAPHAPWHRDLHIFSSYALKHLPGRRLRTKFFLTPFPGFTEAADAIVLTPCQLNVNHLSRNSIYHPPHTHTHTPTPTVASPSGSTGWGGVVVFTGSWMETGRWWQSGTPVLWLKSHTLKKKKKKNCRRVRHTLHCHKNAQLHSK